MRRLADVLAAENAISGLERAPLGDDALMVFHRPGRAACLVSPLGDLTLIGSLYDEVGGRFDAAQLAGIAPSRAPAAKARALVDAGWGRYLALFADGPDRFHVLRDPSGALAAWLIESDGVVLIAPVLPRWLIDAAGILPAVDAAALAHLIANPLVATHHTLLDGIRLLEPGMLVGLGEAAPAAVRCWDPVAIAARSCPDDVAAERLLRAVTAACEGLVDDAARILLQLSGGLDSAIVLGLLTDRMPADRIAAINLATPYREGDEETLARLAADRAGIGLDHRVAWPEAMDLSAFEAMATPVVPRLYGLDTHQEAMVADAALATGAAAILTGQGGDSLFFQMAYPEIAVDEARRRGLGAWTGAMPWIAAERSSCSIWRIWAMMLADRLGRRPRRPPDIYDRRLMAAEVVAGLDPGYFIHPWLQGADRLPPAKRLQLEAIANSQLFFLPTVRARVAPVLHPLLAQPVLEAALAIPVPLLAPDRRDRGLARDVFRPWLPPAIADRSGKGETARYYNRAVVANLPFLRDWLLGGALVARGLLDARALEAVLDADHLMQHDQARAPLFYASVEAWLRQWA